MIELDGAMTALRGAFHGDPGLAPLLVKYYISVVLVFWPALRIIERLGRHVYGALLLFVPLLGFVVMLVWLAFGRQRRTGAA